MTMIERMARSDAAFDGRTFDALGRADKRRYLDRCRAALKAIREPTEGMKTACYLRDWEAAEVWEAMIDAAISEAESE